MNILSILTIFGNQFFLDTLWLSRKIYETFHKNDKKHRSKKAYLNVNKKSNLTYDKAVYEFIDNATETGHFDLKDMINLKQYIELQHSGSTISVTKITPQIYEIKINTKLYSLEIDKDLLTNEVKRQINGRAMFSVNSEYIDYTQYKRLATILNS